MTVLPSILPGPSALPPRPRPRVCFFARPSHCCYSPPFTDQPSDFSLVHMRLATPLEDPSTSPLLLPAPRGVNIPKMSKLRVISVDHGILASNLDPDKLKTERQCSRHFDETGSSAVASGMLHRRSSVSPKHSAPPNAHKTTAMITQLWGLGHSVEYARTRVTNMTANKAPVSLAFGSRIVSELARSKYKPSGPSAAQVTKRRAALLCCSAAPAMHVIFSSRRSTELAEVLLSCV